MADDRRWFIQLNLKPSIRLSNGIWVCPSAVWPLRFKTYQEAFRYALQCNPFRPLPDGRVVISFTIDCSPRRQIRETIMEVEKHV